MVSFLSLYVIAISLLPNIIRLEQHQSQILLACSIVLSVFVIFTSLIDGAQNFYHQGELLHQCARKIATIHLGLKNIDISTNPQDAKKSLEQLQEEYRQALDECPINHDNVDFCKEIASKPSLFPVYYSWKFKYPLVLYNKTKYIVLANGWIILPASACLIISIVVFYFILNGAQFIQY